MTFKIISVIEGSVVVEFTFDDGTVSTQTISFKPYSLTRMDDNGNPFDVMVDPKDDTTQFLTDYAKAFLRGKQVENEVNDSVSSKLTSLVVQEIASTDVV